MYHMKKSKGFTLIELIAAIAILSIAMVGISHALFFSTKMSVKNEKKVNTSTYTQYILQTYKSQGKNYIKSIYSGKNKFSGYCYFDSLDELNNILEGTGSFAEGTYNDMKEGKVRRNRKYGAYVEFTTTNVLGKKAGTANDLALQSGFDNVRIFVQVANFKDVGMTESSLVFYLGR